MVFKCLSARLCTKICVNVKINVDKTRRICSTHLKFRKGLLSPTKCFNNIKASTVGTSNCPSGLGD